jgi:hypothetical protein
VLVSPSAKVAYSKIILRTRRFSERVPEIRIPCFRFERNRLHAVRDVNPKSKIILNFNFQSLTTLACKLFQDACPIPKVGYCLCLMRDTFKNRV